MRRQAAPSFVYILAFAQITGKCFFAFAIFTMTFVTFYRDFDFQAGFSCRLSYMYIYIDSN